jgi:quercetin dioxygenase-like cupin family protein
MGGKAKMAGVRLEEIELMEAWSEENDEVRARFDFPLTAASGCSSCSVIYYVIEPGHRTPMHIHSCEEIQGIVEGTTEVTVGDEVQTFEAEALVVVPALTKHSLENVGNTQLREAAAHRAVVLLSGAHRGPVRPSGRGVAARKRQPAAAPTAPATRAAPV